MNTNYRGGTSEQYFYTSTHELNGAKSDDGYVWSSGFSVRMDEDGKGVEIIGHGYRNSYEQVLNSFGDMYQSDNDDHSSCRNSYVLEYGSAGYYSLDGQFKWQAEKRSGQAIPRAHWRQDNPGRRYKEWYREQLEVDTKSGIVTGDLPKGATHVFINLIDENQFLVSCPKIDSISSRGKKKSSLYAEAVKK